ncbi:hypothetical protein ACWGDE_16185 [Streptomyces sp. NPDC054956]
MPSDLKRAPVVDVAVSKAQSAAEAKAKKTGKPVVVEELTTENAETVANPDGTFTLNQAAGPVRARKNKAWVPIDTKLARRPDGTFAPGATDAEVAFSGGGSGPLVTMVRDGKKVSLTWPAVLPAPVVSGDTATYPAILPDVDLTVTAHADGFSQVLVVKTPEAAANPALATLKLGAQTDGVTLSQAGSGDVLAQDGHGNTVFRADPPLVWDSAENAMPGSEELASARRSATATLVKDAKPGREKAAKSLAAAAAPSEAPGGKAAEPKKSSTAGPGAGAHSTRMGMKVGKGEIVISPDRSILTGRDTVYPLYIDPAWSGNPSVVAWASINDKGWKATTGNEARVGNMGDWSGCGSYCWSVHRSYFEMNADGIRGANVTSATFRPYFTWAADSVAQPTEIWVDTDFPGDLSWGNKPGNGSSNYVTSVPSCIGHYTTSGCAKGPVNFDVTSVAQGAANWGWRNLEVDAHDESSKYQWKKIDPTQTNWSVTYYRAPYLDGQDSTSPTVDGPGGTFVNSHNVTMKATGGGSGGEQVQSGYEIWNWNGGATSGVAGGLFSSFTATGGAYTYPNLADGTYAWRGVTHSQEGGLWSGWSPWHVFTVDTSPPPTPNVYSPEFPKGQFGAGYSDLGTFNFTTNSQNNVAGYIFALDADLGGTVWSQQSQPPTWSPGQQIVRGQQYWTSASNTLASVRFAPGLVGPHHLYVKAVDQAGLTSLSQADHQFWAGLTTPTYVGGDKLVNGNYAITNDDGSTSPTVPAGSITSAGGRLVTQNNCCSVQFYSGAQAIFANGSGSIAPNDTMKLNFVLPRTGYWSLGANLTTSYDFAQYSVTLDKGQPTELALPGVIDAYTGSVGQQYVDFGIPKTAAGDPIELKQGVVHTLTFTVTGKHGSSGGYQIGVDALRLAPGSATCKLNDLTACLNNTAISADNNHDAADADGSGSSYSASQLAAAGWNPGTKLAINGAPMTVPNYAVGKGDNILSSGQTVQVDANDPNNHGNSVVFLAFATGGSAYNASGTITYPKKPDGSSTCGQTTDYPYSLDSVPDWVTGSVPGPAITFTGRNRPGTATDGMVPRLTAISVQLPCPGVPIASIGLPVVTPKAVPSNRALHIMGIGLRQSAYVNGSKVPNWTGTWQARQDWNMGTWTDQTIRIPARITVGNDSSGKVRIRLSNVLGRSPVTLPHVSIAPQSTAASTDRPPLALTFGGSPSVTIPIGAEVMSDPISLDVAQQTTLLVSLHLQGAVPDVPAHGSPQQSVWATPQGSGDHTADASASAFTVSVPGVAYLTGVDVTPASNAVGALVLYGDQTVNSDTTLSDNAHHLNDLIYQKLVDNYLAADPLESPPAPYAVLNAGKSSWYLPNNYLQPLSGSGPTTEQTPRSSGNPVDRAILDNSYVRAVLLSTGAADIQNNVGATEVQKRLAALAYQIRVRKSDDDPTGWTPIRVHIATIPAWANITTGQDTVRKTVNNYIRCGVSSPEDNSCPNGANNPLNGSADVAVDFAAAVSVGNTPGGLLDPVYTWTDGEGRVLPTTSYYQALANKFVATAPGATP